MRLRVLALVVLCAAVVHAQQTNWSSVEKAFGRSGKVMDGGIIKFGMPRSDLNVHIGNVKLLAPFALGSWAAFGGDPKNAMVMGDLVLTENELPQVQDKLEAAGIEISAIHNHVLGETPRVMYMHIAGHGDGIALAKALHDALAVTGTPAASPAPATPPKIPFDRAAIEKAMGKEGVQAGEVLQFSFPRPETIKDGEMTVPPAMGTGTGINFEAAGNGQVAATGDFVLVADEVNRVIKSLRASGVKITALHNHMLNDSPRLFFMHFWGVGQPAALATSMRRALDETAAGKK